MIEKGFVDGLLKTIRSLPLAVAERPSDRFTLGMPDILAWIRLHFETKSMAIEAKQLHPLMEDPFHKGRRTGQMLKHPFTGPQISTLRALKKVGVDAFGLVRASEDTAFRIEPEDIPAKTGNFTHEELVKLGKVVRRENGRWQLWRKDDQVPGPGHRDYSGERDRGDVDPDRGGQGSPP